MPRAVGDAVGLKIASPDKEHPDDSDSSGEAFDKAVKRKFSFLVANSSLKHEDVLRMTIPQIDAYFEGVMRYKIGPHGMIGDKDVEQGSPEQEHTVADGFKFAQMFAGVGG